MRSADDFDGQLAVASDDLERLVARLARFSPIAWRKYRGVVRDLLRALVAICERQQGRSLTEPEIDDHVLAAAIAVVGREALGSLTTAPDPVLLEVATKAISEGLAATR